MKDVQIPLNETFPFEVEATSDPVKKISINMYSLGLELTILRDYYSIAKCTGVGWEYVRFPATIPDGTRIWRIEITGENLVIHCNGEKVLEYLFAESSFNPICTNSWQREEDSYFVFNGIDTASKRFRC